MMGRLRAMREPLKYVQGRDALLKFYEEMGYYANRALRLDSTNIELGNYLMLYHSAENEY